MQANETKMIDKLSIGKIGATPQRAAIEKKAVDIVKIYGTVIGVKLGTDKRNGQDWAALKGEFYAEKTDEPGVIYESGLCFLPAGQDRFEAAIMTGELDKNDKPIYGKIDFAVMVVAVPADNAHKYTWQLRNLVDAAPSNARNRLEALMQAKQAQLAAPAAEGEVKTGKKG